MTINHLRALMTGKGRGPHRAGAVFLLLFVLAALPGGARQRALRDRPAAATVDVCAYIMQHFKCSDPADRDRLSGKLVLRFRVDTNGRLSDFITVKSIGKAADHEVIQLLQAMPPWQPAIRNGHAEAASYTLPVFIHFE